MVLSDMMSIAYRMKTMDESEEDLKNLIVGLQDSPNIRTD